ncbi:capsid cement protein [Tessaracoccus massiliensis]|uniref:capsid cement protein n=1 Tax=Tessaracoccus massiliensis TaxID=1522311 RepID=UPI00058B712C|nr:capsid cement protein [Tessaracoccus massiliensis]
MADYLPKFKPGATVTFTAATEIEGGQAVEITGDRTVGPTSANSATYIGVAGHGALPHAKVTVHTPGQVQQLLAAAPITAGDLLSAADEGQVAPRSEGPIVGLALTSAAAGRRVEVLDRRGHRA